MAAANVGMSVLNRRSVIMSMMKMGLSRRSFASLAVGTDLVSAAPDVSLQKARSWDEGVSSNFSTTSLKDIFKVAHSSSTSLSTVIIYSPSLFLSFLTGEESSYLWASGLLSHAPLDFRLFIILFIYILIVVGRYLLILYQGCFHGCMLCTACP